MNPDTDPSSSFVPDRVFLFSGHRIDAPDRRTPRFPPRSEAIAAAGIGAALDAWGAGPSDLALAQGASGGDLLFLEACLARGLRLQMLLPFAEPEFIRSSILPSADGRQWCERYHALKSRLAIPPQVMPADLELPAGFRIPEKAGPYERCNLWLLHMAMTWGADKLHFLCLWNGGGADGAGGTAHMYSEARRRGARVTWLDTRSLW
ncbi:hypothetical protein [Aromatoleum sp.]|uniref:hypothetical protein n=1 Tax=Aromatoleum sp. TaxID=2307007 RepID=UPI002FCA59AE